MPHPIASKTNYLRTLKSSMTIRPALSTSKSCRRIRATAGHMPKFIAIITLSHRIILVKVPSPALILIKWIHILILFLLI
mmetsp:Transcript_7105/g.902  ORF Transcript_7105/g.902 Transcript_7105/m.902 type:complete len:80 (+) Transcript_7105:352-591(+)